MTERMRSLLVVVDDTPECRVALRFAARRARLIGGRVALLHVIPPTEFVQWGGVQDVIEAEAREKADLLLAAIVEEIRPIVDMPPTTMVRHGKPVEEVKAALLADPTIDALVLAAAAKGAPGPLVSFFAGEGAGQLPCPVIIVPGGLSDTAIERLT